MKENWEMVGWVQIGKGRLGRMGRMGRIKMVRWRRW